MMMMIRHHTSVKKRKEDDDFVTCLPSEDFTVESNRLDVQYGCQ
jgi:hypothetical protein